MKRKGEQQLSCLAGGTTQGGPPPSAPAVGNSATFLISQHGREKGSHR